jgi:hypothetical protein
MSKEVFSGETKTIPSKRGYKVTRKLDDREIKAVYALASYVSYNLKLEWDEVIQMACKNFGVSKIEDVPVGSYNDLISFFVDFEGPSDMMN